MNQTVENLDIDSEATATDTSTISVVTEAPSKEEASVEKVILPYEYAEDEHYYIEDLGEIPKKPFYSFVKRIMDIFISFFGLIFAFIPMVVIAIIIKCTSRGKVFYKQERLGLNGKKFNLIKFRTMIENAESDGIKWSDGDKDPRIYPFGAFLRKFRLDELPQLLQILSGELTIVGPRPERDVFYNAFEEHIHGFRERLKVKQGMTGLAQVKGGYDLRPEEKVVYDVEYIKKRTIWLDIKIMFLTIKTIFTHDGAK